MWIHAGGWVSRLTRVATRRSSISCRQRRFSFHAKACPSNFAERSSRKRTRDATQTLSGFLTAPVMLSAQKRQQDCRTPRRPPSSGQGGDVTFFGFGSIRVCRGKTQRREKTIRECTR